MRTLAILPLALAAGLLAGCVAAPPPVRVVTPAPIVVVPPGAANCYEEQREAQSAQRFANRQRQEAAVYGTQRQANQAYAAQRNANRERSQAARAC